MKLLLLSATPMFNETYWWYICNLLLYNSGQIKSEAQRLKVSTLFTTEGELTDNSRILREVSTGLCHSLDLKILFTFP